MFCYSCRNLVLVKEHIVEMCVELMGSVKYIVMTSVEWLTGVH